MEYSNLSASIAWKLAFVELSIGCVILHIHSNKHIPINCTRNWDEVNHILKKVDYGWESTCTPIAYTFIIFKLKLKIIYNCIHLENIECATWHSLSLYCKLKCDNYLPLKRWLVSTLNNPIIVGYNDFLERSHLSQ